MYAPNSMRKFSLNSICDIMFETVFTLNLEQMLSGAPIDTAIGVLQVTVSSARSLKGAKLGGGAPDPYVSLSLNQRAVLAKTLHKGST
jgi:Ca2+-dependent lipid-binding protein